MKTVEATAVHLEDKQISDLVSRLDAIIQLLARPMRQDTTQKERIWHLSDLGFSASQIARILGATVATVTKDIERKRLATHAKSSKKTNSDRR